MLPETPTPEPIDVPVGAPVFRHNNVHSSQAEPPVASFGLDDSSAVDAANQPEALPQSSHDVHQPVQEAQLAEEQHLEAEDVRCIPMPLTRSFQGSRSLRDLLAC